MKMENMKDNWGLSASIDLYNCDLKLITLESHIKQYVIDLCELIEMKRFGDTIVVNFGEDEKVAGYSMTQLIETSLISGHFANSSKSAYIDIFSCKWYDTNIAARFTANRFNAEYYNIHVTERI